MYQYIHLYIHSYIYLYIYTSIYRYIISRGNYFIPFNLCGKTSVWKILIDRPGRIFHCFQILENFVRPENAKRRKGIFSPTPCIIPYFTHKVNHQFHCLSIPWHRRHSMFRPYLSRSGDESRILRLCP